MLNVFLLDDEPEFTERAVKWTSAFSRSENFDCVARPFNRLEENLLETIGSTEQGSSSIILLDWDWDGESSPAKEFLKRMKGGDACRKWPVIIYSTSKEQDDINEGYLNLATGYFWKGNGGSQRMRFFDLLRIWSVNFMLPKNHS